MIDTRCYRLLLLVVVSVRLLMSKMQLRRRRIFTADERHEVVENVGGAVFRSHVLAVRLITVQRYT